MPKTDNREALEEFFNDMAKGFPKSTAKEIVRIFIMRLGGLRVSVPTFAEIHRLQRNALIRAKFNGGNHRALMEIHSLSYSQVCRIVNKRGN